jgi:hypothetical protein
MFEARQGECARRGMAVTRDKAGRMRDARQGTCERQGWAYLPSLVLLCVLVPSPRSELHDVLNLNVQCFQLLSHLGFAYAIGQFSQQ